MPWGQGKVEQASSPSAYREPYPVDGLSGYTMAWMSKHGIFPLESIVQIDPDALKGQLGLGLGLGLGLRLALGLT